MEQEIYLPSGGALAGIPGEHAPGIYLVDWSARTIRPRPIEQEAPAESSTAEHATAPTAADEIEEE